MRYICHVKLENEEEQLDKDAEEDAHVKPHNMHLRVTNSYLAGRTIGQIHDFLNRDFVCSRVLHDGHVSIPNSKTILELGDLVFIVCAEADAEAIIAFIGPEEQVEWEKQDQPLVSRRVVVTRPSINGKTLGQMHFSTIYGVNVTRVTRQGMDLFANPHLALQVGDRVMVVGPENLVNRVSSVLGNSIKGLNLQTLQQFSLGSLSELFLAACHLLCQECPCHLNLASPADLL